MLRGPDGGRSNISPLACVCDSYGCSMAERVFAIRDLQLEKVKYARQRTRTLAPGNREGQEVEYIR